MNTYDKIILLGSCLNAGLLSACFLKEVREDNSGVLFIGLLCFLIAFSVGILSSFK